jgi:peptidyl-prolyl cis-trans isomerase C
MRSLPVLYVAIAASLLLAACGDKEPKGQVVATFDGDEVTATELKNELGGFQAPDPKTRKQAEQQALGNILSRKALAQAAEKAGVAKTPEFAQQEEVMRETLLVRSWQAQIAKTTPEPSKVEADKFIAEHPDMYAERKIWIVDQLSFPNNTDPALAAALRPLNTLEDVAAMLTSRKIPSRRAEGAIDALSVDPRFTEQILKLPQGEVFVVPNGNVVVANRIRETSVQPFTGTPAVRHATALLKNQRTREALQRQFSSILAASKKDIKYAKAFEPTPPAKAAAPAPQPASK